MLIMKTQHENSRCFDLFFQLNSVSVESWFCHCRKPTFPLKNTSLSKFLDVKQARLAVRIPELSENKRSTAVELGKGVLYFMKVFTQTSRFSAGKLEGEGKFCHFFPCSSGQSLPLLFPHFDHDLVEFSIPANKKYTLV